MRKGSPFELPFYEPERIVDFIEKIISSYIDFGVLSILSLVQEGGEGG